MMELKLPYPPTPKHGPDLAGVWVNAAKTVSGVELDYSPESLVDVEKQLDRFAADGNTAEDIAATLFCCGCYVGEVLVRKLGGKWVLAEESPMATFASWPLVTLMDSGDCWNPIGKVFKRFEDGASESLQYFFSVASGRH